MNIGAVELFIIVVVAIIVAAFVLRSFMRR